MTTDSSNELVASLDNPFAEKDEQDFGVPGQIHSAPGLYEKALKVAAKRDGSKSLT